MDPYKPNYMVVPGDNKGMRSDALRDVLSQSGEKSKPKFLYINPTGANPTGTMVPESRRREIYDLASQHDMLILEDDPYYFLQFASGDSRPRSFLSMDTEGRVLRFDSFSKVLSSGLRLGFVTGPSPLIERINLHMQVHFIRLFCKSAQLLCKLKKVQIWSQNATSYSYATVIGQNNFYH